MVSRARAQKIGRRIQEELASLLQREVADPRLTMVTVTGVDVDREVAYATVYVSAFGGSERRDEVMQALRGAAGFLRSELASRVQLRSFPRLRFRWDETPDRGARIEDLIDRMKHDEDQGGRGRADT